ncbi:MAG TPA: hypothetical protein HA230_01025 [Candidatus Aenigmarchaeota archaeon]|nr:hypothetical protein [Candidatus Aenigmarchaeota archaeon]
MVMKKRREEEIKNLVSREYKLYQEEERFASLPQTLYEKATRFAVRTLNIQPDKKSRGKIQETIDFAHLKTTPGGIMSLTILFLLVTMIPTMILIGTYLTFHQEVDDKAYNELIIFSTSVNETVTPVNSSIRYSVVTGFSGIPLGYGAVVLFLSLFFTYYLHTYPARLKRRYVSEAGSEIVTLVLYIAMYMRNVPNLEAAVKFSAENLGGILGYEMKKLLWDVEVGNYLSMQEAIIAYTERWSNNRPFVESIEIMITSLKQVGDRRLVLLDEAVNIILQGSRERARHFNQDLKLPVMVVHALGVILPIMGLVLFPIVAVFLGVSGMILFVGYDIILPLILYFVISGILETRPTTFSKIDISENPDVPPEGKFAYGKKYVKAWPIGLITGVVIIAIGIIMAVNENNVAAAFNGTFEGIYPAIVIGLGVALGFGSYYILISKQRLGIRTKTRQIENEFAEALFQLGNQISGGTPIEVSIEHSMARIQNLKIKELFSRALKNMKMLGFTFSQAFFDKEYGAIRYYPSKMIKSIMRTVVESSKKGVSTASLAMISISRYLKGLHDTQEEVQDQLNDTLNSLKFQSYFLSPLISGIVVTLAVVIMRILTEIGKKVANFGSINVPFLAQFGQVKITAFEFILIVSIYLIETAFILAMFINSIESGEDKIGRQDVTGRSLVVGFIVFTVCLLLTLALFGPLIENTLTQ